MVRGISPSTPHPNQVKDLIDCLLEDAITFVHIPMATMSGNSDGSDPDVEKAPRHRKLAVAQDFFQAPTGLGVFFF